ncbi:MAG: hypothetical protein NVSMB68_13790 [Thermoanaerobaculia bacterium]
MAAEFPIRHNEAQSRFECDVDGKLSVVEYERGPETITFTHTGVPQELSGRGIAQKLVSTALDHARRHKLQVIPLCTYVAAYIERHAEYRDLVSD